MAKICSESVGEFYHHYPRLAVIVTCHARSRRNAMAAAWHAPLSFDPPLYGVSISPRRFTYKLILQAGEFGINFLPLERAELIAAVGGSKGEEVDKFQRFSLATEKSLKTVAPVLKDAYASYECKLVDHKTYGDHEWFVGKVVAVHCQGEALTDNGVLDLGQVKPALYLGADRYLTAAKESLRHLERKVYGGSV